MLKTTADIVKDVSEVTGYSQRDVNIIILKFLEKIKEELKKDKVVVINGLGEFKLSDDNKKVIEFKPE